MNRALVKRGAAALLAIGALLALNLLRAQNDGDRVYREIFLPEDRAVECVVDLKEMGFLKYWLEPNVISVYLRFHAPEAAGDLRCEISNLSADVSQGSKKGLWKRVRPGAPLERNKRQIVPLNLEVSFPRGSLGQYEVHVGEVTLLSAERIVSQVRLRIVDSNYAP